MTWRVRVGELESGPYTETEVADLVRKGLHNAVVKPDGGTWVHLSMSEVAQFIPRTPSRRGLKIAVTLAFMVIAGVTIGNCVVAKMQRDAKYAVDHGWMLPESSH